MRHPLRNVLIVLHVCGLLSLPNYYRDVWKNRLHRVYSTLVLSFFYLYLISVTATLFIFCRRDFSEFCAKFFEWVIGLNTGFAIGFVKWNVARVERLLDMLEEFGSYHRGNKILVSWRRRTDKIIYVGWRIQTYLLIVLNLLPLLPTPPDEQERLRRIYDLNYPQNTLAFPIFVPFVDPSEPTAYVILYCVMLYVGFLTISLSFLVNYPYPIFVGDFKYYTQVVCEFVRRIGSVHCDGEGRQIFFTSLIRNEYILKDSVNRVDSNFVYTPNGVFMSEKVLSLRSAFLHRPELYEYFYLIQVMLIQKKLNCLREMLDDVFSVVFNFCSISCLAGLMMSAYSIYIPSGSSIGTFKKYAEGPILIFFYIVLFTCGEILADCNNKLNRALFYSFWYKCSAHTRREYVMMLRSTQKIKYVTIFNMYDMGFELMVSTFRMVYTFFNLMNLQRSYLQHE